MSTFIDLDSTYRNRELFANPCHYVLSGEQVQSWLRSSRTVVPLPNRSQAFPSDFTNSVQIVSLVLPYTPETAALPRVYLDFHCNKYHDKFLVQSIDSRQADTKFICSFDKVQCDDNIATQQAYAVIGPVTITATSRGFSGNGIVVTFTDTGTLSVSSSSSSTFLVTFDSATSTPANVVSAINAYIAAHPEVSGLVANVTDPSPPALFTTTGTFTLSGGVGKEAWIHYKCGMEQVMRFARDDTVYFSIMDSLNTVIPITDNALPSPVNPARQVYCTFEITPYYRDNTYEHRTETGSMSSLYPHRL